MHSNGTFAIYWELKRFSYKDPKPLAREANAVFVRFPSFNSKAEQLRQLKAELYKVLLPVAQGKRMWKSPTAS